MEDEQRKRDMVFVSHANPEDNEFARWLALRLAVEGFPVWCDQTKLLGGEDFWSDIEHAIRDRTVKFVYVLSKASNYKPGATKELHLAESVARRAGFRNFIIPVVIDDLSPADFNIRVASLNAIFFNRSWAEGLSALLKRLREDGVDRDLRFSPSAVASWWQELHREDAILRTEQERYTSNWYPVTEMPGSLFVHTIDEDSPAVDEEAPARFALHRFRNMVVSFATAQQLGLLALSSTEYQISEFLAGAKAQGGMSVGEARVALGRLLTMAWDMMVNSRRLPTHGFANKTRCFFFPRDYPDEKAARLPGAGSRLRRKALTGYASVWDVHSHSKRKRFWHFGVEAQGQVHPQIVFVIKPHVVFSDDGRNIWESESNLARSRRSQCKDWWNDDWRDRILASMSWLWQGTDGMKIQVSPDRTMIIGPAPVTFESPVCFRDSDVKSRYQAPATPAGSSAEGDEDGGLK